MVRRPIQKQWWAIPLEKWESITGKPFVRTRETGILSWSGKRFVLATREFLAKTFSPGQRPFIQKSSHPITEKGIRFSSPARTRRRPLK